MNYPYRRVLAWQPVLVLVLALVMTPLVWEVPVAPDTVRAQDGKQTAALSWSDAPLVPRHRSAADWLVEVGRKRDDEVYGPFPTREYVPGDTEQLIPLGSGRTVDGLVQPDVFLMQLRTEHAYFWFQRGVHVDPAKLAYTAQFFEDHIWPLNSRIYGSEWNPGIDGDSRMHIVSQMTIAPGVFGAFNPDDQCPRSLCPESNQREIIYIGLDVAPLGSPEYLATLAHEHQHLIQYTVDGNERRWFNEGLSQLAEHLNGFHPRDVGGGNLTSFLDNPDHALDGWSFGADVGRYYGASYLFMVYLYERYGLDLIRALAADDYDGLASVQRVLAAQDDGQSVDDVFADWILATYLDDPTVGDGRYYYQTLDLPVPVRAQTLDLSGGVARANDTINQYGADYYTLTAPGTYHVSFDGSDQVDVLPTEPHAGDWMWWSYNAASGAARMTAAFDLTGLERATLAFDAWWQVEANYDWFQVLVSDNGGADWRIVSGDVATLAGPHAPGAHYSGRSAGWVAERIDLSAYAGSQVLVRIEYLTDESGTLQGVALDDVGILELGQLDGAESAPDAVPKNPAHAGAGWQPEGFIRVPAQVVQNWTVRLVHRDSTGQTQVIPLVLDARNAGGLTVTLAVGGSAALVVGAMAPFTAEPASYKLVLHRQPG